MCNEKEFKRILKTGSSSSEAINIEMIESNKRVEKIVKETEMKLRSILL